MTRKTITSETEIDMISLNVIEIFPSIQQILIWPENVFARRKQTKWENLHDCTQNM